MSDARPVSRAEFVAFQDEVRAELAFLRTLAEARAAALRKATEEDERAAAEVLADLERFRAAQKPLPDSRPLIAMLEARLAAREAATQADGSPKA